jgi:hypothetical protein
VNTAQGHRIVVRLSFLLVILVIIVSIIGLFFPDTYSKETPNWTAQAVGQDMFDLFVIVPFLIIAAIFIQRKSRIALLLWGGVIFYLVYTFVIYCFAVHFSRLFIFYCMILGLSFYSLVYFLLSQIKESVTDWFEKKAPVKGVGIYLIAIACVFYLLWLSEIMPAIIAGATPKNIVEIGLLTNPVHALDLSVVLPGFIVVGVLLLRKKPLGLLLAPTVLVFMFLMDLTIGGLNIVMRARGLEASYILSAVMAGLALVSICLLALYFRSLKHDM